MKFMLWVCAVALGLSACTEADFNALVTLGDMESVNNYSNRSPGPVALRRLTRAQFKNTISQLLGEGIVVPKLSEPDSNAGGLLAVGASSTTYSPRGVESLEGVAYSIAKQAIELDAHLSYLTCTPGQAGDVGCAEVFINEFGRMAWRRSLVEGEVRKVTSIFSEAAQTFESFERGIEFAIAAILQSPYFLFRVELGEAGLSSEQREFRGVELASRLSFFLWNSTPDAALLTAAENGSLDSRAGLFEQASRMLDSPRAKQGMRNFFMEQFKLYELEHLVKDPTIFEHYHRDLGGDAREETLRLFERIVFEDNADFRDVMTSEHSYLNRRLATLYRVPAPVEEGFAYVEIPGNQRIGLLGHASFLGLHSHPVSTSATLRGKAVRNILLCQSIPLPPVNVDTSIPEPSGTTRTLRERVAEHLTEPSCAGCHQMTDPIGLALENFDGIGRWRQTDHGEWIDASGELDGNTFEDMRGLAKAIRKHPAFTPCMVKTLASYAVGRTTTREESDWLNTLSERFEHHGFRFKRIILEVIMSPLFLQAGPMRTLEESQ